MNTQIINCQVYNSICEAVGCSAKGTNEIAVKVGRNRAISLSLCDDFISKFQENKVYRYQNKDPDPKGVEAEWGMLSLNLCNDCVKKFHDFGGM